MPTTLLDLESATLRRGLTAAAPPLPGNVSRLRLAVAPMWEGLPALRRTAAASGIDLAMQPPHGAAIADDDATMIVHASAFADSLYRPRPPQHAPKRLSWYRLVQDDPTRALAAAAPGFVCVAGSVREDTVGGLARLLARAEALAGAFAAGTRPQVRVVWSVWQPEDGGSPGVAVAHAVLQGLAALGCDVTLHRPDGFDLDIAVLAEAERRIEEAGGRCVVAASPPTDTDAPLCWALPWAAVRWYDDAPREQARRATVHGWPTRPSPWPDAAGEHAIRLWLAHCLQTASSTPP